MNFSIKRVTTIRSRKANVIESPDRENQQRASNTIVPSAAHTPGDVHSAVSRGGNMSTLRQRYRLLNSRVRIHRHMYFL